MLIGGSRGNSFLLPSIILKYFPSPLSHNMCSNFSMNTCAFSVTCLRAQKLYEIFMQWCYTIDRICCRLDISGPLLFPPRQVLWPKYWTVLMVAFRPGRYMGTAFGATENLKNMVVEFLTSQNDHTRGSNKCWTLWSHVYSRPCILFGVSFPRSWQDIRSDKSVGFHGIPWKFSIYIDIIPPH